MIFCVVKTGNITDYLRSISFFYRHDREKRILCFYHFTTFNRLGLCDGLTTWDKASPGGWLMFHYTCAAKCPFPGDYHTTESETDYTGLSVLYNVSNSKE